MKQLSFPSLKAMAENGNVNGVKKMTIFEVDPRQVIIESGFNRPIDPEHVKSIKKTVMAGGTLDPIWVRIDAASGDKPILVDGEHRLKAVLEALDEGLAEPPNGYKMAAQQFRGNDAERVAHLLTSSQGLALTPLQRGQQYAKLAAFGWEPAQIADKVGKTSVHVAELITLAQADTSVQTMVSSGKVSAAVATKAVRKHGSNAAQELKTLLADAEKSGRKKITAKSVDGKTTNNLPEAIRLEIVSGGTVKAQDVCPKHADLIEYLRHSIPCWDLMSHITRQRIFSEKTFGPGKRTAGICDHIMKEIFELSQVNTDTEALEECVDIILLALDASWRLGFEPWEICSAIAKKQCINEDRTWPDWRTAEPGKAIEHIKD